MKALGKLEKKPGLWLYDAPIPEIGPNDVLIKVKKTSLCGTDLHIYNWDEWASQTIPVPMTVGHEFFGHIAKIGSNVTGFSVGDRVAGEGHIICNHCRQCLEGHYHLCPNTQGVGVNRPGCFAEYVAIPAFNAFKLPDFISDDIAAILDPFGNAVHTALAFDVVGEDVLVTGAGAIGLMATAIAQKIGAKNIVVTDINDSRLKMALKMGATATVNTQTQSIKDVCNIAGGFTVGFEMSGVERALNQMIDVMANGAKIALLGILPINTHVDGTKLVFKSLELKGIYGREMFATWHKAIALIESGLDLHPLITHQLVPEQFEEAFHAMQTGACGKIILNWS